ncbi:effector-associated constant component EACC1 [Streptomyces caatingaensis]|uniref:Uncharacterized protein n=1 Tax=Streptomyces caatingaensis TaxID=1678637 RepID=A0A0K9XHB8_9ACTN|nr:hypothetical protein [Streptomyces caatingaensis]KNB52789.1 hypothetical protein AC230_09080 [Streptomyces caatingaensis]
MTLIEVRVEEQDQDEALRSLSTWLAGDSAVRRFAEVSLAERPAGSGAMGGWLEAVQLVTENGWSAASFVLSLVTWRRTRPQPHRVTIRHGDVELSLNHATPEEIERIVTALNSAAGRGTGSTHP